MTTAFDALADELLLAEAADLARRGDYAGAAALLERDATDDTARLDLLARVHAQAGDFDLADAAWARVLELAPESASAQAGRRVISRVRSGRLRRRPVGRRLAAAGVGVLVVAGAAAVVVTLPWSSGSQPAAAAPASPALQAEVDRLHTSLSREADAARTRADRLTALAARLAAPGVRTAVTGSAVSVTFDEGLFNPDATSPSRAGRESLERWAAVLKGQPVRITVLGHGVAVAGGPATGGSTIALARAAAAARVLATASGLPLTTFAISSADQTAAAHPAGDAAANRTVTVEVAPAD
ncbi:tetratricopeptide repeat protein [Amycolatopsis sp. NPDC051903]|uniref:tetratricopeptide repeat protein n=1 Tax=Amycolatopsis sp. NPDC051903 TaxID=3363936 RepID=UPI0037983C95